MIFSFVGSSHPPSSTVPQNNCAAVAGIRSDEGWALLNTDLPLHAPDIITMMFGANDISFPTVTNLGFWAGMIDKNIGTCFRLRPNCGVIIGPCTPMLVNDARRIALNEYLLHYAAAHLRCGRKIAVADTATAYTTSDLQDGVHPNAAGCILLGDAWADKIIEMLPIWGFAAPKILMAGDSITAGFTPNFDGPRQRVWDRLIAA